MKNLKFEHFRKINSRLNTHKKHVDDVIEKLAPKLSENISKEKDFDVYEAYMKLIKN
jgi:hypothetical protein